MSNQLAPPIALEGTNALVQVCVRYDDVCIKSNQMLALIDVPDCPVKPLVTVQAMDNGGNVHGIIWAYDWVTGFFGEFHKGDLNIPKTKKPEKKTKKKAKKVESSAPTVKDESPQLNLSALSKVELDSKVDAMNPPVDGNDDAESGELDE